MGILTGNQKLEPMHYGEVFGVWDHLFRAQGCLGKFQLLMNHAGDKDLKKFIGNLIDEVITPETKNLENLLRDNGVPLPPGPQKRPIIDPESIPAGARFMDMEVAACIYHDIAMGLTSSSKIISIATREDIAKLFAQHQAQVVKYGGKLLQLMKQKAWLTLPPVHSEPAKVEA